MEEEERIVITAWKDEPQGIWRVEVAVDMPGMDSVGVERAISERALLVAKDPKALISYLIMSMQNLLLYHLGLAHTETIQEDVL